MLAMGNWKLMREALGHLSWSASDQIEWLGSMMCPYVPSAAQAVMRSPMECARYHLG